MLNPNHRFMSDNPFWQQLRDKKLQGKTSMEEIRAGKAAKGTFFANQIANAPKCCENCGKPLTGTKSINAAAIVCHIIPKGKAGCPSVATHPMNRWFGCGDCHTDYDNKGAKFVQNMPIFETLRERVKVFYKKIAPAERRRVPLYFRSTTEQ